MILSGKVSLNINETKYMMMEGVPGIYYAGQANSCWGMTSAWQCTYDVGANGGWANYAS